MLPLSPSFATLKASLSPLPSAPRPVLYKPPGTKPGSPPGRTVASASLQKPKSFDEAFKMAKGQKTFTYKGKSYARVTKDEMKKAGFKSLIAYLNAQKGTKKTKIAKRP